MSPYLFHLPTNATVPLTGKTSQRMMMLPLLDSFLYVLMFESIILSPSNVLLVSAHDKTTQIIQLLHVHLLISVKLERYLGNFPYTLMVKSLLYLPVYDRLKPYSSWVVLKILCFSLVWGEKFGSVGWSLDRTGCSNRTIISKQTLNLVLERIKQGTLNIRKGTPKVLNPI